jgi:hypothetical protein
MSDTEAYENTDREIWRGPDEGNGSYYADSIFVTKEGAIGINCGGLVHVRSIREWHRMAAQSFNEGCALCGHSRAEHSYNGTCYGLCGEFVPPLHMDKTP